MWRFKSRIWSFLQAGLAVLDEKYSAYDMNDPVKMTKILAEQKPNWEPGKLLSFVGPQMDCFCFCFCWTFRCEHLWHPVVKNIIGNDTYVGKNDYK